MKHKDIQEWQVSVFDSLEKPSPCVETNPNKKMQQLEKEYLEEQGPVMKVIDPDLYNCLFPTNKKDLKDKKPEPKAELELYQENKQKERAADLDKEREDVQKSKFVYSSSSSNKDPHRGMRFVNAYEPINKGKLGSSQAWREKSEKKYEYY